MTTLTLISKPDCHLCDVAREIIDVVISELPESDVEVAELSILDDPALYATWWEKIPAVLIDDRLHALLETIHGLLLQTGNTVRATGDRTASPWRITTRSPTAN